MLKDAVMWNGKLVTPVKGKSQSQYELGCRLRFEHIWHLWMRYWKHLYANTKCFTSVSLYDYSRIHMTHLQFSDIKIVIFITHMQLIHCAHPVEFDYPM